jgi:competence protein ComEC
MRSLPEPVPPMSAVCAGDRFAFGEVLIEVLWPPGDLDTALWAANDRSLVLRIDAYGRRVLLPGDIERDALQAVVGAHRAGAIDLSADVLVAPHHGSVVPRDTAEFLETVSPSVVVNSSGRERPKLAALTREVLGEAARLLSTHDVGAVAVHLTRDGHARVETPFAQRE